MSPTTSDERPTGCALKRLPSGRRLRGDQRGDDREPETATAQRGSGTRTRRLRAVEPLEHARLLLLGQAGAFVGDLDEVRERTWDFQRMSALTPAQFAFGKVLGAPVYGDGEYLAVNASAVRITGRCISSIGRRA